MNFIDPQLRPVLDKDNVIVQPSGGQGGMEPTALATVFTVSPSPTASRSSWTSTATSSAEQNPEPGKIPKRGDGIPSPRFLPSIPLGSPSGRAVTEGD